MNQYRLSRVTEPLQFDSSGTRLSFHALPAIRVGCNVPAHTVALMSEIAYGYGMSLGQSWLTWMLVATFKRGKYVIYVQKVWL